MKLARLTSEGIIAFTDFLDNIQTSDISDKRGIILESPSLTEIISDTECIDIDKFPTSKIKASEYLYDLVSAAGIPSPEKDVGLWSWLSLMYFEKLCKKKNGNYVPGFLANWILEPQIYNRYYKQKLAGPWRVYKNYKDNPEIAMSILAGTIDVPGEVYGVLASSQEIVSNSSLIELSTYLYYDRKNNKLKTGAAGKVAGASRRLTTVIQQFARTWDLYGMDYKGIAELLPVEFDKFTS